jgi:hypothetical protein
MQIIFYSKTKSFKSDLIVSLKGQCHKLSDLRFFMNGTGIFYYSHFIFVLIATQGAVPGVNNTGGKREKCLNRMFFHILFCD